MRGFKHIPLYWLMSVPVIACLLLPGCKKGAFTAVLRPEKTTSATIENVTVTLDLAPDNLMKNNLTVVNGSGAPVRIDPRNIILRINRAGISLNAVHSFKEYVSMRYAAAEDACAGSKNNYYCADAVESFFSPFRHAESFEGGVLNPGEKRSGLIAFNLPDPLNHSAEALAVADSLRNRGNQIEAQVVVTVSLNDRDLAFIVPVRVVTYVKPDQLPLKVMRSF